MVAAAAEVKLDLIPHLPRMGDPVFVAVVAECIEACHRLADVRDKQRKAAR